MECIEHSEVVFQPVFHSLCCIIAIYVLIYICHTKFNFRKGISITAEP